MESQSDGGVAMKTLWMFLYPKIFHLLKTIQKSGEKKITELHGLFLEKNLSFTIKLVFEVSILKAEGYYFI